MQLPKMTHVQSPFCNQKHILQQNSNDVYPQKASDVWDTPCHFEEFCTKKHKGPDPSCFGGGGEA